MVAVGTYKSKTINAGNVSVNNNNIINSFAINKFVGSASNEDNRIDTTNVDLDLDVFVDDVSQNEKYDNFNLNTGSEFTQSSYPLILPLTENAKYYTSSMVNNIADTELSTSAEVASQSKSLLDTLGEKFNQVKDWLWYHATHPLETLKKTGASVGNTVVGLVQGLGEFAEALVDTATIIGAASNTPLYAFLDGISWVGSKMFGYEFHSMTKSLWSNTMDFVSEKYVTNAFDSFHANSQIGKWLDDNSFSPFKSTGAAYKVADGVGYIGGILALTLATMGIGTAVSGGAAAAGTSAASSAGTLATIHVGNVATLNITQQAVTSGLIATTAGFGKNTQNAWADGASLGEGLTYGGAMGLYEGFEMFLGASINTLRISGFTGLQGQILNTVSHVGLDTIDGASGTFVNPLLQMIYAPTESNMQQILYLINYDENGNQISNKTWEELTFTEKYNALFEYNGGWSTVGVNAVMAGTVSLLTEIPDIRAAVKPLTNEEAVKLLARIQKDYDIDLRESSQISDMLEGKITLTAKDIDDILQVKLGTQNIEDTVKQSEHVVDDTLDSKATIQKSEEEIIIRRDSVNVQNFKTINVDEFLNQSLEDQLKQVESANIFNIWKLFKDDRVSKEVLDCLEQRVIKNQDFIILEACKGNMSIGKYIDYIVQNPNIIKELSDDNLVKVLANMDSSKIADSFIIEEVISRIENGKLLFGSANIERNFYGRYIQDMNTALNRLANNNMDAFENLKNMVKEKVYAYLPEDIRKLNYGIFTQQLVLADMIEKGLIDSRGLDIIRMLNDQNVRALNTFDLRMLNSEFLDTFGTDFVLSIGPFSEISSKIISLKNNNPDLYDLFVKIVKDAQSDNSLNNLYTITDSSLSFLFDNSEHLKNIGSIDIQTLQEYILFYRNYGERIDVDLSPKFYEDLYAQCDKKFYDSLESYRSLGFLNDLDSMKDSYFQKYFSMTYKEAKGLVAKYGDHIDEIVGQIDSEETLKYIAILDYIKSIDSVESVDDLVKLYEGQNIRISSEELLFLDETLRLEYTKTYEEALRATAEKIKSSPSRFVDYNGTQVEIVPMDDFSLLVYSSDTGFTMEKTLINDSYIQTWNQVADPKTHGLSTSYITAQNIGSCPVERDGVLYGFTTVGRDTIKEMGPYDINSHIANYGFSSGNQQVFISADNMSRNTTRVYNEFVLNRSDVTPDYIVLYTDASDTLKQNALKAASEWNIPIVEIDIERLAKQQVDHINNLADSFVRSGDINELKEAIDIYEANVSGYKLNANDSIKMDADYTAEVSHQSVAGMFDSTKLEVTVLDYIDEIKRSNDVTKIEELRRVLEDVQARYDISETNGTSAITHTKSGVDVNTLLELLNEGE